MWQRLNFFLNYTNGINWVNFKLKKKLQLPKTHFPRPLLKSFSLKNVQQVVAFFGPFSANLKVINIFDKKQQFKQKHPLQIKGTFKINDQIKRLISLCSFIIIFFSYSWTHATVDKGRRLELWNTAIKNTVYTVHSPMSLWALEDLFPLQQHQLQLRLIKCRLSILLFHGFPLNVIAQYF